MTDKNLAQSLREHYRDDPPPVAQRGAFTNGWQPSERLEALLADRAALGYTAYVAKHGRKAVYELSGYAIGRSAALVAGTFTSSEKETTS